MVTFLLRYRHIIITAATLKQLLNRVPIFHFYKYPQTNYSIVGREKGAEC